MALMTDLGHPGHAADQDNVSDVALLDLCVVDGLLARTRRALDQVVHQTLKLGARQLEVHVLGSR